MSTFYDVEWNVNPKNIEKYRQVLNQYLDDFLKEKKDRPMDKIFEILLKGKGLGYSKVGENHYIGSFEEDALWEDLLTDAFFATVPYLKDGSKLFISLDNYDRNLFIKDGSCIDSNDVVVKLLDKTDTRSVTSLDLLSGYHVLDALKRNDENDCYGLFYKNEMLGYCSLTSAEKIRDTVKVGEDDLLLFNVFMKEEWRHSGMASVMIREVTDSLDCDCYIKCPEKDIMDFFLFFDFKKVENAENIMVRKE